MTVLIGKKSNEFYLLYVYIYICKYICVAVIFLCDCVFVCVHVCVCVCACVWGEYVVCSSIVLVWERG